MPKPKNEQSCELIAHAAYYLFLEQGYNNTTYQDIENLCGIKRTMVQHYFPKKSLLALSFFERLLSETIKYLNDSGLKSENRFLNMFFIGQIHFAFVLKDEKAKTFTLDIISSRELTDEVLLFDYDWGMKYLGVEAEKQNLKLLDDIISTMGGFYELLYRCLKDKRDIEISDQLGKVIINIMEDLGYSHEEAKSLVLNNTLNETDFKKVNLHLEKIFSVANSGKKRGKASDHNELSG